MFFTTGEINKYMDTNKELNYRLHLHREEDFLRTDIQSEFSRYDDIKNGNYKKVQENLDYIKKNYYVGKGALADDPVRNVMYHFVVSAGIIARVCIDAGLPHDESYTLSDIYIRRADKCTEPSQIIDLLCEMQLDYAKRMNETKKQNGVSKHVRRAIEYINDHLNLPLTMADVAASENLDPSYFSRLFSKEMNCTAKAYILNTNIMTAQNILVNTDYPISEIALSLGFSSQSAFCATFKKLTSHTPLSFRNAFSNSPV